MKKYLLILVAIILSLGAVLSGCAQKVDLSGIQTQLDTINSTLTDLGTQVSDLSTQVDTLKGQRITVSLETIAEDNSTLETGVMVLGLHPTKSGWRLPALSGEDLIAHYKLLVTVNGIPTSPDYFLCFVARKDQVNPPDTNKQFPNETLVTKLTDTTQYFVCKSRYIIPGVGATDLYYAGPETAEYVGDYIAQFTVGVKVGESTIWASDLQNLCVLGWSMDSNSLITTLPDGNKRFSWTNPFGPFTSTEDAVFWQRIFLDLTIPSSS